MRARLLKAFKFTLVLILVAFTANFLPTAAAQAAKPADPKGNNGTIKVHEKGTPSGTESNDPKVCEFNFEGFGFDKNQSGYIVIDEQPGAAQYGPYSFGPTNNAGYAQTAYFNDGTGPSIPNGHYKATLYGKMGPNGQLSDEKAKSKVFKVNCRKALKPENPQISVKVDTCATKRQTVDALITVTNPDEGAGNAKYDVTVGLNTQTVNLSDGESQQFAFSGLSAGDYTVNVTGNDGTSASQQFTVDACAKKPKVKIKVGACVDSNSANGVLKVKINNRNAYDVTYSVNVASETKDVNIAANSKDTVKFTGLIAGNYTITISGSDGTSVIKSANLGECPAGPVNPTLLVTTGPCLFGNANGTLTVKVTNPNDLEVTYAVTVNGVTQFVTVAANNSQQVSFSGLAIGTYTVEATSANDTWATTEAPLQGCPGQGAGPVITDDPTKPVAQTESLVQSPLTTPATIPATGINPISLLIALLASGLTYAIALKLQRRRIQLTSN